LYKGAATYQPSLTSRLRDQPNQTKPNQTKQNQTKVLPIVNMESLSYAITDDAVTGLVNFSGDIFDNLFIKNLDVRRKVCEMLLADSSFIDSSENKYTLSGAVFESDSALKSKDIQEVTKPNVDIYVSLTSAQRTVLINNNADYNLVFKDASPAPHPLAYAQRVIDTVRCKSMINYRNGVVIDMGGNFATHAMSTSGMRIHSCTLKEDIEEYHRQTQRNVLLKLSDTPTPSMCTCGIEQCDVYATEAFSLHTLPRINPERIPHIFYRHGLQYMTGVHHYDPNMDTMKSGYMPDVELHWERQGPDVNFYFENDSSYEYLHRLDWLKVYSHTNFFTTADYSFVVYYTVERLQHGILRWSMFRLDKETLGTQTIHPQYRFFDTEESLVIVVPEFDEEKGFPITDGRAYSPVPVQVPKELFEQVYKTSLSNDTARPDTPLSLDDVRGFAHTYNYTRRINGTNITVDSRLSSYHIDMIAKGMYLIVVQRAAQLKAISGEYTKMFMRVQKRWGDENFLFLMTKCFSRAAISPFLLMTENISHAIDLFSIHMRATIRNSKVLASVNQELPYYLLSPTQLIEGTANMTFTRNNDGVAVTVSDPDTDVDVTKFYEAFKDELKPAHAKILEEQIARQRDVVREQIQTSLQQNELPDINETRESWEDGIEYVAEHVPLKPNMGMQTVSQEEVLEDTQMRIYEAGLYNYDVAIGVVANARERCSEMWTGTGFNEAGLKSRNNTTDLGIKFLKVERGIVLPGQGASDYSVALDPVSNELIHLPKDTDECVVNTNSPYLFVYEAFKIFLGFKIGKKLVNYARFMKEIRPHKRTLVDGVPGCGKTHEIVSKMNPENLIACAVRETSQSTRTRVLAAQPKVSANRVRTIDSCVINSTPTAQLLMIDEGLMLIPGSADYVAQVSKAKEVQVYGDSAQIGFIDRGSKLGMLRFEKLVVWEQIEFRNVSVRVPADICFAMRTLYPEWRRDSIKTRNPIRRSVTVTYEPELQSYVYTKPEPGVMAMTITTADRDVLCTKPGFVYAKDGNAKTRSDVTVVLTVHEAQGTDVAHSSFIRLNVFENPIFLSKPHILVGITRHTHTIHARSTVNELGDNGMMDILRIAANATDEDLDDCMETTPDWLQDKIDKAKPRGVI